MVSYQFYGDNHIIGLRSDSGQEVFIELSDIANVDRYFDEDAGVHSLPVCVFPEDVYHLFASHGCAEQCPYCDGEGNLLPEYK